MSDSLCRLTVHVRGDEAVDLALPGDTSVAQLMPSVIDMLCQGSYLPEGAHYWRLSRVGGPALDESISLNDNAVRDGDLLLLSADAPPGPRWVDLDPSHLVARTGSADGGRLLQVMPAICCVFLAATAAVALMWSATRLALVGQVVAGGAVAAATAAGAVLAWRVRGDGLLCVPLSLVAVIFAATVGALAVPAGSPAAQVLLASAAAFSTSIVLVRLIGCGTIWLTAVAAVSLLTSAVAAAGVLWRVAPAAGGALLATLSLGLLAAAPRIAIVLTGIGPAMPSADDADGPAMDVVPAQAMVAHQTLSGLVTGSSACAAFGAGLAAYGSLRAGGSALSAAALPVIIALVLVLRTRTFADGGRMVALTVSGMGSATAGFAVGVVSLPTHTHWLSLLAAAAGVGALCPMLGLAVSPAARRVAEIVDYLAIAAVVPVACWVGGLYELVRGANLL